MIAAALPSRRELLRAFNNRDQSYEGVFVTAERLQQVRFLLTET